MLSPVNRCDGLKSLNNVAGYRNLMQTHTSNKTHSLINNALLPFQQLLLLVGHF